MKDDVKIKLTETPERRINLVKQSLGRDPKHKSDCYSYYMNFALKKLYPAYNEANNRKIRNLPEHLRPKPS